MTQFLSTLKTGVRVAVVALTLGGGALATMPAQAAGIQYGFQFGSGNGFDGGSFGLYFGNGPRTHSCMTDRQLRRALGDEGFDDIRIVRDLGRHRVAVVASYNNRWYKLRVNRCTGDVDQIQRLRRTGTQFFDQNGNSFGLSLNFGN